MHAHQRIILYHLEMSRNMANVIFPCIVLTITFPLSNMECIAQSYIENGQIILGLYRVCRLMSELALFNIHRLHGTV